VRRQNEKDSHKEISKDQKKKKPVLAKPTAGEFKNILSVCRNRLVID